MDLGKDLLLNSAEKQASPASTAFAPPPWAVSKGFAHPTQTQLVLRPRQTQVPANGGEPRRRQCNHLLRRERVKQMDDRHPSCKPVGTSECPNRHARASRGKSSIDSTGRRTIEMLAAQHAKPNAQEPKRLRASTIVPIYPSDPASIAADARSDRGRASRRQVNGIQAVPQSLPRQATAHALHVTSATASATHARWHGAVPGKPAGPNGHTRRTASF